MLLSTLSWAVPVVESSCNPSHTLITYLLTAVGGFSSSLMGLKQPISNTTFSQSDHAVSSAAHWAVRFSLLCHDSAVVRHAYPNSGRKKEEKKKPPRRLSTPRGSPRLVSSVPPVHPCPHSSGVQRSGDQGISVCKQGLTFANGDRRFFDRQRSTRLPQASSCPALLSRPSHSLPGAGALELLDLGQAAQPPLPGPRTASTLKLP